MLIARLLALALAFPPQVLAEPTGKLIKQFDSEPFYSEFHLQGHLTFSLEQADDIVTQYVTNHYPCPVTLDVLFETEGLDPFPFPETQVILPKRFGREKVRIADFRLTDADGGWKWNVSYAFHFGSIVNRPHPYVYAIPFEAGKPLKVTQAFGGKFSHNDEENYYAIDVPMPEGTKVRCARDGLVIAYNDSATRGGTDASFLDANQGNWLHILHADGTIGVYAHLKPKGVRVQVGQVVKRNDWIALSGNTGYSSGPHLHFGVVAPKSGTALQSYPFLLKTDTQDTKGKTPSEGMTLTAFERK